MVLPLNMQIEHFIIGGFRMAILITGGAGYIGSHTCVELLNAGYEIVVADNFSNSKPEVLNRVRHLTGKDFRFYQVDILHRESVDRIFRENNVDAVIHFAGYKAVGESMSMPIKYYYNNIMGTLVLCSTMKKFGVKRLVFSSSATVYGVPHSVPIQEDFPLGATTNPYGRTKLMLEEILRDIYISDNNWSIVLLRYFNPIGAHHTGIIGEDPRCIPSNLLPYLSQVAAGKIKELKVFGNDYNTHDGTGIRDYIHVVDLARGHLKGLCQVLTSTGVNVYNLGTGRGYSVLEVINTFEAVSGRRIPYRIVDRRPGDVAICYADPSKAKKELGWVAERGIEEMCADVWRWQSNNPNGYDDLYRIPEPRAVC